MYTVNTTDEFDHWLNSINRDPTMQLTAKELEAALLKLPVDERVRLLEALLASLEPDHSVQQAWLDLARNRRNEVRVGKVSMIPGDEALARVRLRLE